MYLRALLLSELFKYLSHKHITIGGELIAAFAVLLPECGYQPFDYFQLMIGKIVCGDQIPLFHSRKVIQRYVEYRGR